MFTRMRRGLFLALFILVSPAIGATAAFDHVDVIDGRVTVSRAGEFDVVVMIDHLPSNGDGIADQAFVFRSEEALPSDLHDLEAAARVAVRRGALILMPRGERNIVLTIIPDGGQQHAFVAAMKTQAIFVETGYQLTRIFGAPDENLELRVHDMLPIEPISKMELAVGGECCDGGPGESSCTCNGCSVDCSAGYYACCSSEGCKCKDGGFF